MPMSSSAAFCYTLCQTASIVSATMASSPMAPEPTASLSVSGCLMAVTLVPASLPTIAAKAIARSPQPTSQSVPIAGAPCGRSQPCRAPATLSHSPVTRHDCPADVYDHHARPPRGQQCLHRYRVANQSLSSGMPSVPTLEINAIVPHSSRPVCTENLIRIDCVTESPNVNGDDRALLPLPDPVRALLRLSSRCRGRPNCRAGRPA